MLVDNDVNWAARAERDSAATGMDDFVYLHLGEGLGCAVVSDGDVRPGHGGLSGEIAHLLTRGRHGRAVPFTEVFAQLGLRQGSSTAVDVAAVRALVDGDGGVVAGSRARDDLVDAVGGVLLAVTALLDPEAVVLGGTWGRSAGFVDALRAGAEDWPRPVRLVPATHADAPDLIGARTRAIDLLRTTVVESVSARRRS